MARLPMTPEEVAASYQEAEYDATEDGEYNEYDESYGHEPHADFPELDLDGE
jgi:hypothetical protein